MAKRRRRSRPLPPKDPDRKKRQVVHLDSMDCPNHNMIFDITKKPGAGEVDSHRYPMMHIAKSEKGGGTATGLAFVDDVYNLRTWVDRDIEAPPTWMDPEIFIRIVVADPRVRALCEKYIAAGDAGTKGGLKKRIQELFEEQYLVYMLEQFSEVKHLIADWTVGHFATLDMDEKLKPTGRKRRRKRPS